MSRIDDLRDAAAALDLRDSRYKELESTWNYQMDQARYFTSFNSALHGQSKAKATKIRKDAMNKANEAQREMSNHRQSCPECKSSE